MQDIVTQANRPPGSPQNPVQDLHSVPYDVETDLIDLGHTEHIFRNVTLLRTTSSTTSYHHTTIGTTEGYLPNCASCMKTPAPQSTNTPGRHTPTTILGRYSTNFCRTEIQIGIN